ncbi:peptidoglycan DD-metalloendopeptidase family protein [Nocardia brasiliensis]|uniref:peptidoglycan DD-metalloendopeptidase family protein n=1 Tax=Nocardia brasiliensis TaxID=37326 RepID=UPI0024567168|nr:peptidoglycan DD-metalloendopeptidase family protein [Nocardia brasiliensis]
MVSITIIALAVAAGPVGAEPTPDGLDDAISDTLVREQIPEATEKDPVIDRMRSDGEWVFGAATVPQDGDSEDAPKSTLYVAKLDDDDDWTVALEGTPEFGHLVSAAPESVVSHGEKAALTAPQPRSANTALSLPWPQGQAWYMGGGPHGVSGSSRPYNSLDFNGGDGRVVAPASGRVYKTCVRNGSAEVKIVHNNGLSTTYYHMTNVIDAANGSEIAAGTYLGHIGTQLPCGGFASGPHVHMSLYRGNEPISLNGTTMGGWTFREGPEAYGGFAERAGKQVRAGGRLMNYGGGDDSNPAPPTATPTPPPTSKPPITPKPPTPAPPTPKPPTTPPTPEPDPTLANGIVRPYPDRNRKVNLRSGPGTRNAIVGTVRDGDSVTIVCTARGDRLDGKWGPTDLWNKLDTGKWISDGFLYTGSNGPVAPDCAEPAPPHRPTPGTGTDGEENQTEDEWPDSEWPEPESPGDDWPDDGWTWDWWQYDW